MRNERKGPQTGERRENEANAAAEITAMISELNQACMRLDALLRRMVRDPNGIQAAAERARLAARFDRLRDKLYNRLRQTP